MAGDWGDFIQQFKERSINGMSLAFCCSQYSYWPCLGDDMARVVLSNQLFWVMALIPAAAVRLLAIFASHPLQVLPLT